ncbi:MAG: thioredoxin [Bifidobacteriaceae bacterium]|jgi:thioredoxin 1|nr:thioredoxin [Bifidobacteriaceae bacterium]
MEIIHLTEENFAEITEKSQSIIIDFWASWCVPCQQFSPIFEKMAEQYPQIQFAKIDVDDNKDLSIKSNISSIPTIWAFKNGETIYKEPGAITPEKFEKIIKKLQD